MAIGSVAHHDSINSTTNASTYSGAASAPNANRLLVACITAGGGSGGNTTISSLSGYGLSWTAVSGPHNIDTAGAATSDAWLYAVDSGGSPSSTAFSVTFAASRTGCRVSIFEVDGADLSGGIAAAFVQVVERLMSAGGTATSGTITLASAGHADNRAFGWFTHEVNEASTAGTNFTAIRGSVAGELNLNNPNLGCLSEWRSDAFDTGVAASWATAALWGGFAFELKADVGGDTTATPATVAAVAAVPSPTVQAAAVASPSTVAAVAAVPSPTVLVAGSATATPATVAVVATVPAPTVYDGTTVTISVSDWYINGQIVNPGSVAEGQLLNARMVQAIFDAEIVGASTNPHHYSYPDELGWERPRDPDRNLDELIAQLATYRDDGLNMITVCMQGGATGINATEDAYFTGGTGISGWNADGTLKAAWQARLVELMSACDALNIVLNVQCIYSNRQSVLTDNAAVTNALENLADLILDPAVNGVKHFKGVLFEIGNELATTETHTVLSLTNLHTTIADLRSYISTNHSGKSLLISFSQAGGAIPPSNLMGVVDYISLHAGFSTPASEMVTDVAAIRASGDYNDQPIMYTEAGADLERAEAAVVTSGVGWGFYQQGNPRLNLTADADYLTGFQSPPVNWSWKVTKTKRDAINQLRAWAAPANAPRPATVAVFASIPAPTVAASTGRETITTPTILTEGRNSTDLGAYTTGSFTPAANQWIIAALNVGQTSGPMAPVTEITDTAGLTWTRIDDANSRGAVTPSREIELWYAKVGGSPSSMTVTFTQSGEGGSTPWVFGAWKIIQLPADVHATAPIGLDYDTEDDDPAETNPSGAGWSPTAPAFEHANNRGLLLTYHEANEAVTDGGGYTKLGTDQAGTAPTTSFSSAVGAANDSTPTPTWATSSSFAALLVELRAGITVSGDATATPATVAAIGAVPAPTVQAAAAPAPATVAAVASVPAPTVAAAAVTAPSTVAAVAAVPAPTVQASAITAPATVAAVAAVPAPTVLVGGNATAAPATVAAVATVPAPTVQAAAQVTPSTVATVASVPAPTVIAGGAATATPATVAVVAAVPAPVVLVGGAATATPATVAAIAAVPSPTVLAAARATPATVAALAAVPSSTLRSDQLVTAATVAATASVPAPTVRGAAIVTPATVPALAQVGVPSFPGLVELQFLTEGRAGAMHDDIEGRTGALIGTLEG